MARRAQLGGGTLNPFGGGGVDFGAFNIVDRGNEAYLAFLKVETAWNAGKATNDAYLAALKVYADAQTPNSSDWVSIHARLDQATYQVHRNVLLAKIDARTASVADLLAFDKKSLDGLVPDSQEYQQRLDLYRQSQAKLISDEEKKQVDLYQAGKITTTQLSKWYENVLTGPVIDKNPDLEDSLKGRITELADRVTQERDSKMLSDFNDGKVTTSDFLAYATAAKARYAAGTTQAQEWNSRINDARTNASETALLYRYNLSQDYAQLAQFVKSNSGGRKGGTSSSTRVVLGEDGHWHTVTTTKSTAPSASAQAAYAKLQVELADAKRQMAEIARKVSSVGGFVQSKQVLSFYQRKLGTLAKGSDQWYAVQGKIDNLNDRIHQEHVLSGQGVRITYPSGGGGGPTSTRSAGAGGHSAAATGGASGGGYTLDQFMRAIAKQESGGRYDARNASTGAYGKYQILPSNWASWAQKAGLPADAPQTPENQEKVATAAFQRLAKSYGNDWSRVAAAWFAGVGGSGRGPADWGPRTQHYVNSVMSIMGTTVAGVSRAGAIAPGSPAGGSHRAAAAVPPAAAARSGGGGSGPLSQITSIGVGGRRHTTEVVGTQSRSFPKNLDGQAFERFYTNYERAFENGEESFVDTSSGHPIAYFIGSDPVERIGRMRQLDDLRVQLYDTRAQAYAGTPSELTANNQRNEAYKDVARHEYLIVDTGTGQNASAKINAAVNPLAAGVRLLDKTAAAIQSNLAMAVAAYKRGDVTGAYSLFQMADQLKSANGAAMQNLAMYAAAADQKIKGIEAATGGIGLEEALGQSKADAVNADLARLAAFDTEITSLFNDKASAEALTELKSHLKLDAGGNAMWDNPGDPRAQLVLTDDTVRILKPNGQIEISNLPPSYHNGQMSFNDPKSVTVTVKSGANVFQAQAQWTAGEVGSFVDPNNPNNLLPIMGKVVQQRNPDGSWTTFYENPFAPGTKNGWSSTPWVFNAPTGFTTVPNGRDTIYQFTAGGGARSGAGAVSPGTTYSLVWDPATATYSINYKDPGGLFSSASEGVIGLDGADGQNLMQQVGVQRQGGGSFNGEMPVFGFGSEADYKTWLRSFQPPAIAAVKPYGGPSLEARDAAYAARSGGPSLEDRDAAYAARQAGNAAAASQYAARAKAQYIGGLTDGAAAAASALAARAQAERAIASRQTPAAVPGLSPAQSNQIAQRAALPKPDPEYLVTQRKRTSSLPAIQPPKPAAPVPAPVKSTTTTNRRPTRKAVAPPPVAATPVGVSSTQRRAL